MSTHSENSMASTVLSVRVPEELKEQLDYLSRSAKRSRAYLAAEALGDYVKKNAWRASEFPTTEAHLPDCPAPRSAYGFSKLTGEVYCRAAHEEHGLPFTICRPFNAYGPGEVPDAEPGIAHAVPDLIKKTLSGQRPLRIFGKGEQTRTLTHVDDIADGIVTAMASQAGLNEDFNISAARELTVAQIAGIVWEACGEDPEELALEHLPSFAVDVPRRWPSVEKARRLLGWEAKIGVEEGVAATVRWLREREGIGSRP
jgi:UDP-glucose 4-epimerase